MIKYFYYEEHYINGECIIRNEMVLNERPDTIFGWTMFFGENYSKYYIDIEKRIENNNCLDKKEKQVYDKLMLIEIRNKKLETL